MNEDALNMSIRKLLKKVGITSQREIEIAVRKALEEGKLAGKSSLSVAVKLHLPELDLDHEIKGKIELE
ncbi:DUF6494 family protein [Kiloniella laminariae]|uniref:DUF6494 family protein n=1 Tax=Kiloniella laminariae TaxID=454162 RepID=A0ABT4LNH1_9PROT|nr:DUF6494 family protein [Kiloniella laminariae]MCZ4282435.1 DUF6494 family protein [Kiloniella laminariae]